MAALSERGIRPRLDSYITTKQPQDLPSVLPSALIIPATAGSSISTYNLPLITSLVVRVTVALRTSFMLYISAFLAVVEFIFKLYLAQLY